MYRLFRIKCTRENLDRIEKLLGNDLFPRTYEENPSTHFLIKIKDGKTCHCRRVPTLIQVYDTTEDIEDYLLECMLEN